MSSIVRFVVDVDHEWNVTISCPQHQAAWAAEPAATPWQLRRVDGAKRSFPAPPVALHLPDTKHDTLAGTATPETIEATYDSIWRNEGAEIKTFGHYLYDALLGERQGDGSAGAPTVAPWTAMQQFAELHKADTLELGLSLGDDADLQRLNWEMMCSDAGFIAAGTKKLRVAITRLVPVEGAPPAQLGTPPRVLFVVGTSLSDESIRPGAELLGLIRRLKTERTIHRRLLERAKPSQLRETVRSFRPDVVHFICHGGVNEQGEPYLDLVNEQDDTDPQQYAAQLAVGLRNEEGGYPTIVVLSACHTAGSPGAERYVLAGARQNAPLAGALVKAGVPIVIGMSGRITDVTCRLFTRRFGESIVNGEQLVPALAEARMATFTEAGNPDAKIDWALPTLFLGTTVPADYQPVPAPTDDGNWKDVTEFIRGSTLERGVRDPVFCGRQDFVDALMSLLSQPKPKVLGIQVERTGYGRGRLLEELAIQVVNEGHIPVLLRQPKDGSPVNLHRFGTLMASVIERSVFRLGPHEPLQLRAVLEYPKPSDRLDRDTLDALDRAGQPTPWTVREAMRRDLAALKRDTSVEHPLFGGPDTTTVVLLDKIESYERELLAEMFQEIDQERGRIFNPYGLGKAGEPVPVVVSFAVGGGVPNPLNEIAHGEFKEDWLTVKALGPFTEGEDVVAYRWVLLNPFESSRNDVSGKRWTFADLDDQVIRTWEESFRKVVQGIPEKLADGSLQSAAIVASSFNALVEADDDHSLDLVRLPR